MSTSPPDWPPPDAGYRPFPYELPGTRLPPPAPRRARRTWLHLLLPVLTLITMTEAGAGFWASFVSEIGTRPLRITATEALVGGLWYSLSGMAIVLAHEFGHYLACVYYRVDATLPYLIPFPNLLGTMGAFIKIQSPIPNRRALFDIGVAGPLAGFVVAAILLFASVPMSRIVRLQPNAGTINFGEPLIFHAAVWLFWGTVPEGSGINLHPMGFAAWAGCFLTAMNLLPVWQLDGGHIAYALVRRRSTLITAASVLVCIAFAFFFSWNWAVWAAMFVGVMLFFGPHHFPTMDDELPLDRPRVVLAVVAAAVLVLCFMPVPFEVANLLGPGR